MKQNCVDEFKHFNLPFQTFFNACTTHEEETHDEMEFIWLFEGEITIQCEGRTFKIIPNHVFMIYIGQKHSILSSNNSVSISFRLNKDYIQKLNLSFDKIPFENRIYTFNELAYKYHEVPLIMSQLIRLMKSKKLDTTDHYRLIGYYNMYLYDLYSVRLKDRYLDVKKKNYDPYLVRFYKINDYINKNYQKKITLKELAGLVGISTFRLSHFIREILGITLQEYISNIRLDKAIQLLKTTNLPIQSVVQQSGFSDQKYLNQAIRNKFHVTASKYRKIMNDNIHFGLEGVSFFDMINELSYHLHNIHDQLGIVDTYGLNKNIQDIHDDKSS